MVYDSYSTDMMHYQSRAIRDGLKASIQRLDKAKAHIPPPLKMKQNVMDQDWVAPSDNLDFHKAGLHAAEAADFICNFAWHAVMHGLILIFSVSPLRLTFFAFSWLTMSWSTGEETGLIVPTLTSQNDDLVTQQDADCGKGRAVYDEMLQALSNFESGSQEITKSPKDQAFYSALRTLLSDVSAVLDIDKRVVRAMAAHKWYDKHRPRFHSEDLTAISAALAASLSLGSTQQQMQQQQSWPGTNSNQYNNVVQHKQVIGLWNIPRSNADSFGVCLNRALWTEFSSSNLLAGYLS